MAKRKTPKAEKVIDLTPKPEKITDVQLNKVQSTVRTMDQITMELGRIDIQKHGLLRGLENVQTELDVLRGEFNKQYGTDNINIQDGIVKFTTTFSGEHKNKLGKIDRRLDCISSGEYEKHLVGQILAKNISR